MSGRRAQPTRAALSGVEPILKIVARERQIPARQDLLREGEIPRSVHLLVAGHVCRYRTLSDGRRQITAILVPGDICDLEAALRGRADYSVSALSACTVGEVPLDRVTDFGTGDAALTRVLWQQLLRDEAVAREWLVSLGRRTALERVAHLFCELRVRMQAVGLASADIVEARITQAELADALGLSTVHVNRTLQELRRAELIRLSGSTLTILDGPALEQVAGFDAAYLKVL